jgi:prophage tail gpP-like protein
MSSDFTLQINNTTYTNFKSMSVSRDMESISGGFSFTGSTYTGGNFPIPRGAFCVASIGKFKLVSGYVDKINVGYSSDSHDITVSGRDRTQDIVDSTIDNSIELLAPISLENVIKRVLSYLNINDIKIINQVQGLQPYSKGDLISAEIGQGAFDFLDQYCRKRAVFLTADGEGNIIITRGEGIKTNAQLVHIISNTTGNNVLNATVDYDDSKRFNLYTFKSQVNTSSLNSLNTNVSPQNIVSVKATVDDSLVRKTRKYVKKAEKSSTQSDLQDRALWERNIRGARSAVYTCNVNGFYLPDRTDIWKPLQLVKVIDEYANVNDELIVVSVQYSLDISGGSKTQLKLAPKIAYNLRPEKPRKKDKNAAQAVSLPNFDYNAYYSKIKR